MNVLLPLILTALLLNASTKAASTVHPDGRATFTLNAPEARQVQIDIKGKTHAANDSKPYDMTQTDEGLWTFTSAPLDPGFHYYFLYIDGFRIADSSEPLFFGWGRLTNGVEIPDPNLDCYVERDVPRGEIRLRRYYSQLTQSWRELRVYTPPQYGTSIEERYPVLYLQHGAGENQTSWSEQGRAGVIMDNLLADQKCVPMIIVMENGYAYPPNGEVDDSGQPINQFDQLLLEETIPLIEEHYRVLPDKESRALAGLSMGGGQAMRIGLEVFDRFSYLGSFSGAARDVGALAVHIKRINQNLKLIWIGCGTEDRVYERSLAAHQELTRIGVRHEFYSHPGTHEWQSWRLHLSLFAPKLFRD